MVIVMQVVMIARVHSVRLLVHEWVCHFTDFTDKANKGPLTAEEPDIRLRHPNYFSICVRLASLLMSWSPAWSIVARASLTNSGGKSISSNRAIAFRVDDGPA